MLKSFFMLLSDIFVLDETSLQKCPIFLQIFLFYLFFNLMSHLFSYLCQKHVIWITLRFIRIDFIINLTQSGVYRTPLLQVRLNFHPHQILQRIEYILITTMIWLLNGSDCWHLHRHRSFCGLSSLQRWLL